MMEKKDIGKCLSELPDGNASKIVGLSGTNGILTTPDKVAEAGGCGVLNLGRVNRGKWYRIAFGNNGAAINTALANFGTNFGETPAKSQLLYVSADGYSGTQIVESLVFSGKLISKTRILYKSTTTDKVMFDVYINLPGINTLRVAYCCNIGLIFQTAIEVDDIPETGYSVKEFLF